MNTKNTKKEDFNKDFDYYAEIEETLSEPLKIKLQKIKALQKEGKSLYSDKFSKTAQIYQIKEKYANLSPGEKTEDFYKIAGRAMLFRIHGKAAFCDLKDSEDKIQLYLNIKTMGESKYNEFLNLDIGDWIGVEGNVFVTHKGELSLNVVDFKLLCKTIRIMPEKWHGLKDVELRYRQRYLDFIVNPEVKKIFLIIFKIV